MGIEYEEEGTSILLNLLHRGQILAYILLDKKIYYSIPVRAVLGLKVVSDVYVYLEFGLMKVHTENKVNSVGTSHDSCAVTSSPA